MLRQKSSIERRREMGEAVDKERRYREMIKRLNVHLKQAGKPPVLTEMEHAAKRAATKKAAAAKKAAVPKFPDPLTGVMMTRRQQEALAHGPMGRAADRKMRSLQGKQFKKSIK